MKAIITTELIDITDALKAGVVIDAKGKNLTVTGPRGVLVRNFGHLNVDLSFVNGGNGIKVDVWFAKRKEIACVHTIVSHIKNMFIGVTQGFRYRMRLVYAHFPININIVKNKTLEIRNFLGERVLREVHMLGDTTLDRGKEIKDELVIEGNDVDLVSRSAALINQITTVKNKDIRKFLDGIYVTEKGPIPVKADDDE